MEFFHDRGSYRGPHFAAILRHKGNPLSPFQDRGVGDVLTFDDDLSGGRFHQPHDGVDQFKLAVAFNPCHPHNFSLTDFQMDIFQLVAPVGTDMGQIFDCKDYRTGHFGFAQ